jgi:Rrf2 family nitric oxide-sensitive transcriptional repressor
MRLARDPDGITIGEVVRQMEPHFKLVECQSEELGDCRAAPICSLKSVLDNALEQFLSYLDGYTLADAVRPGASRASLNKLFMQISPGGN